MISLTEAVKRLQGGEETQQHGSRDDYDLAWSILKALPLPTNFPPHYFIEEYGNPCSSVDVALDLLRLVLPNWWLTKLEHAHCAIILKGDKHEPLCWAAMIQHRGGGRMTHGSSKESPGAALTAAICLAVEKVGEDLR